MGDDIVCGEWTGGKPVGHICQRGHASYLLIFPASMPGPRFVTFSAKSYGDDERTALRAAESHRYDQSKAAGKLRNQWRTITELSTGDTWIEVQLARDKTMLIDVADLPIVEAHTLCVSDGYACHSRRLEGGKTIHPKFHRMLLPDAEFVDHIDGKTLDNRRRNIRAVTRLVNARNHKLSSVNKSGITGVYYKKGAYIAAWHEDGKKHTRTFCVARRGDEEAWRLAVQFRQSINERLGIIARDQDPLKRYREHGIDTTTLVEGERPAKRQRLLAPFNDTVVAAPPQ